MGKLRKNVVSGNLKCSRLEPQDKGFIAYARQLFSNYNFFYVYDFSDIDECKGNHSCHVNAACMNTLGSHVCQCHAGYTGNGANCTGKFNLFSTICRIVLHVLHVRLQCRAVQLRCKTIRQFITKKLGHFVHTC